MVSFKTQQRQWLFYFLLISFLIFLLPNVAVAKESAAQVLFSQGNVVLTNNAGSYPLEKGSELDAGDTVITGEDGRIQIRFSDGGLVSLMPNSRFAVEEYSQPTASDEGSATVNLLKGGLRALSGSIGKKDHERYQLKTDVATLGIRGTQFVVVMDGAAMRVHVGQGSVSLLNDFGELLVPTGQHAQVLPGQAPVITTSAPAYTATRKPNTQSEEEKEKTNQDPAAANTGSDVVRALEPGVSQGEKPGTFEVTNKDGEVFILDVPRAQSKPDPEPTDPNFPGNYDDGFAFAMITSDPTTNETDLTSISYGPKIMEQTGGNPADMQFKEMGEFQQVGDLYWGQTKGSDFGQTQTDQNFDFTQIWGAAASDLPLEGVLNYKLAANGALPMHTSWEGEELTQFNMGINLHGNNKANFSVNMATTTMSFSGVANDEVFITSPQSGGAEDFNVGQFAYTAAPTESPRPEDCTSCNLDVSGFLSGNGGAQAGVVYKLKTSDGDLAGGAILDKQ